VRGLFAFIPSSNILLVLTNEYHRLIWSGFERNELVDNVLIFQHGPAFAWLTVTSYLLILFIIVNLWLASRKGSDISRRQTRLLLYATLFPVAADLLYLSDIGGLKGVDWTSVTFSVTGILFLYALSNTRLLDIVPIARDQVIGSLGDGLLVLDTQNRIIDVNLAVVRMMNTQPEFLIGRQLADVTLLPASFSSRPPEQEVKSELEIDGPNKRYFDLLHSPLRDGKGKLLGSFITFRDVTDRKENELRLLQLTLAVEQSPASVLITDLQGIIQYVNPQFSILTGYTHDEAIGQKTSIIKSGLTPNEVYRDMWQTLLSGSPWRGEFLNRKKNGDLYWEQAVMSPVIDASGKIINFIAVKEDITQRKQAEDALRLSEERFRQLVTSAPDAVFGIDVNGCILFANYEAAKLLGYAEDELIGKSVDILVPEGMRDQHVEHRGSYYAHARTRSMAVGRELAAKRKDGSEVPVEINLSRSVTEKGLLVIAHMRDITRRKRAEDALRNANQQLETQIRQIETLQASLREQAIRDPLTQMHNRRFLNEAIEQEFHHAARASEALSIILLDIDHFKTINDTYGHLAGDMCLVALAKLLQQNLRKSDISCRYGGEEFMLVLPATSLEGAARYADRLRLLVGDEIFQMEGQEIRLTISVGIASYPQHGATHAEIITKADDALYVSKREGRNRVTIWSHADP
jgi:diguanylate cyclase (GGDEF)-like protein/PAS domain S-box-containing protein